MIILEGETYFSLKEIASSTLYSPDYLRIRILQKKLQARKISGEWNTTQGWLATYMERYASPAKKDSFFLKIDAPIEATHEIPEIRVTGTAVARPFLSNVSQVQVSSRKHTTRDFWAKSAIRRRSDHRAFSILLRNQFPVHLFFVPVGLVLLLFGIWGFYCLNFTS